MTSKRFDKTEPIMEAATTLFNPLNNAANPKIISTALPKVAFSNPPIASPNRTARSSVTSANQDIVCDITHSQPNSTTQQHIKILKH